MFFQNIIESKRLRSRRGVKWCLLYEDRKRKSLFIWLLPFNLDKIQATYQMTELYFLHINQSFVQFFYSIPKVVTSTWTPYPIYKKIRDLSSTGNESGIHSVDFTGKHYLSLFPDLKITRWTSTCTFLHTIEVWETWEPLNVLQNIPEKREMYILNACCLKVYKRTSWLHNLKKQQQRMSKKHSLLDRGS